MNLNPQQQTRTTREPQTNCVLAIAPGNPPTGGRGSDGMYAEGVVLAANVFQSCS